MTFDDLQGHEQRFLLALKRDGEVTLNAFLPLADRDSDRARSKLKKLGLIRFHRKAWAWQLTDAGVALRASHEESRHG
ncbi:MAG: hypothetical protein DI629_12215 [Mesorhizobium amorphae]|nr:MAG: hypothetical protein DI629_12215 [Mesorhizobium amorphae]